MKTQQTFLQLKHRHGSVAQLCDVTSPDQSKSPGTRGLYREAGLAGKPGQFQFSSSSSFSLMEDRKPAFIGAYRHLLYMSV